MPLTGQPFVTTQPWSAGSVMDVMRTLVSDTEEESKEAVGELLLTRLMLFLHRLSVRIADEVFDQGDSSEKEEGEEETDEEELTEEQTSAMAAKLNKQYEDPDFVTWMFQFLGSFADVLCTRALDIATLLGLDARGMIDALVVGESIMPFTPCCLGPDAVSKLSDLCSELYENLLQSSELHLTRPSEMAIHLWKLTKEPEKTEDDIEDEALVESYIVTHPAEIAVIEKEEFHRTVMETLEEHKEELNGFVSAYGPKYIELLTLRSILPQLDAHPSGLQNSDHRF